MFNSKYSKVLTIVLIVVIMAIVILLGFLGYDIYKKYSIDGESKDAVSRFEDQFNSITNTIDNTTDNNTINSDSNETIVPNLNLNEINNNVSSSTSSGSSSSSSGSTVKYKGYDVIGTIEIPATNIKYPIIKQEDVSMNSLNVAICNLYGELNKPGSNAVLVGHNFRNGTFFSNNKKLVKGDKIYITDNTGKKVTYVVYKKYETGSGDFDYASRDVGNKREISLSTCTNDSKKRLIIWAAEE